MYSFLTDPPPHQSSEKPTSDLTGTAFPQDIVVAHSAADGQLFRTQGEIEAAAARKSTSPHKESESRGEDENDLSGRHTSALPSPVVPVNQETFYNMSQVRAIGQER